jgi:Polysaccharide deacetylase
MAATPPPGRTSKLASRSSVNRAQVHVRWDRVLVLFALVAVLAIVVVHSVVIVVRDYLRGDAAKPTPVEVGNPPANKAAECPRPATGAIRTAPAVLGEAAASQRTVALTFDDGPGASTPEVLGVLQKAGVHATFFVVDERAAVGLTQQHPVILLHDGPGNRAATVAALEGIINDYRSRGYRFVTFAQSG